MSPRKTETLTLEQILSIIENSDEVRAVYIRNMFNALFAEAKKRTIEIEKLFSLEMPQPDFMYFPSGYSK